MKKSKISYLEWFFHPFPTRLPNMWVSGWVCWWWHGMPVVSRCGWCCHGGVNALWWWMLSAGILLHQRETVPHSQFFVAVTIFPSAKVELSKNFVDLVTTCTVTTTGTNLSSMASPRATNHDHDHHFQHPEWQTDRPKRRQMRHLGPR